jgi:hypothetical protein
MRRAATDQTLIALCARVVAHENILDKYAPDERNYDAIPEVVRSARGIDSALATIIKTPAVSVAGLQAKACVVLLNDDYAGEIEAYGQVAQSLARDLTAALRT